MFVFGNNFYMYMNNPFMSGCCCNPFGNPFMFNVLSNMMNNIFAMPTQMFLPQMSYQFTMPQQMYPMQSVFSYTAPTITTTTSPSLFSVQKPAKKETSVISSEDGKGNLSSKKVYNYFSNNINGIASHDISKYSVSEKIMPNGTKVLACGWSKFDKCQPEWINQQQYLLQAAKEHGFTILFSDMTRTVAESNAGRAKKGSLVCRGGESPHNYGVATDLVCYKNGKAVDVNSTEYTAFAKRAVELSGNKIEWGGEWNKKGERHHFNLRNWKNIYKNSTYLIA